MLNSQEQALATAMLANFAAQLANDGCNDWEFPPEWTLLQRQNFAREFHAWNGSPEDFEPMNPRMQDNDVARFLAHRMQTMSRDYTVKACTATENYLAGYLTPDQWQKMKRWAASHAGPYELRFSPTGIGLAVQVTAANGAKEDLTDYESF